MPATQFTTVNRGWLIKMVIFLVVLVGFGIYGLVDAMIVYPARGYEDASYKKKVYLELCEDAGKVGKPELFDKASIAAPDATHATLVARRTELVEAEKQGIELSKLKATTDAQGQKAERDFRDLLPKLVDAAKLHWLDSLKLVGGLKPSPSPVPADVDKARHRTNFDDPKAELTALKTYWASQTPPKELAFYDLPMQWAFAAIGFGFGAYLLYLIAKTKKDRYGWDPEEKRLYLPSGKTLIPDDVAEFDKRKWDKFFVFLHLKPQAGTGQIKLDLLRQAKLEEWVLEMERIAFPENAGKPV